MKNNGFNIEYDIVNAINGKKYADITNNLAFMIKDIFKEIDNDQIIYAYRVDGFNKADIAIVVDKETKYLSIKTARAEVVHQEHIDTFVKFLRENGISEETITTLLLFHFGDGTTNGTGTERQDYEYLIYKYKNELVKANQELNKDKEFIIKCMDRFVFVGTDNQTVPAEYVYHGNVNFGVVIDRNQLKKHIERRTWLFIRNPHVGPLHFRPHARYHDKEVKNPEYLFKVDVTWVNMAADLDYISTRYDH